MDHDDVIFISGLVLTVFSGGIVVGLVMAAAISDWRRGKGRGRG